MGEVKVLIQNFLFLRVLGEVKIGIYPELFVSSITGWSAGNIPEPFRAFHHIRLTFINAYIGLAFMT